MKKHLVIFTFFIFYFSFFTSTAQNLVPNPSFENYTVCPYDYYMLPTDWYTCSGDPDYFNACDSTNAFGVPTNGFGYQQAGDGRAYCGFFAISFCSIPYYKEYLGCQLLTPLVVNQIYYISFKVSRAEWPKIACNNIGLLFSTQSYQDYQPYDLVFGIPTINFAHIVDTVIIQDSTNWTIIKGSIIADSAYKYILIGDFFDSNYTKVIIYDSSNFFQQKSYYYLDEVCVSKDSLMCNIPDAINENSVCVSDINIFPNPTEGIININFSKPDVKLIYCDFFDIFGRLIKQTTIKNFEKINVSDFIEGIYFLQMKVQNKIITKKIIIYKP